MTVVGFLDAAVMALPWLVAIGSRSGKAPVPVPGPVRFAVEAAVFGTAVAALATAGVPLVALGYAAALVAYHATAYDRLRWLLSN
ncbi:DUF2568 domain-containing protein [Streptomyces sp. H10-C2]|uniref:DUF2568 domain-containing protein n=1 Tax=Streptomyces sp. H10-C2 TaxID=3046210 RepID=UPI0032D57592